MIDSYLPVIIILMFGVPHGAADTYLAKKIGLTCNIFKTILFVAGYVMVAFLFFAVWHLNSLLFLFIFFIISVYHFSNDHYFNSSVLERLSSHSIILFASFITKENEVYTILRSILKNDADTAIFVHSIQFIFYLSFIIYLSSYFISSKKVLIEVFIMLAVSIVFNPIWYFTIYFCLLHSYKNFKSIFYLIGPNIKNYSSMFFNTILVYIVFVITFIFHEKGLFAVEEIVIRNMFILLACLSVPHIFFQEIIKKT